LRRILRRLTLSLKSLEIELYKVEELIKAVIEKYATFYSELKNFDKIKQVIFDEIVNFEKTLNVGLKAFNKLIRENDDDEKLGEKIFLLYTTYGLPVEISREILKERKMNWNQRAQAVFSELFKKHRSISKNE
jgi:alanyl-tRNA synthetase